MAATSASVRAQQDQIQASREASAYFQQFDKYTLHGAVPQRESGWLLGEKTHEDLSPHVPIRPFSLPCGGGDPCALFIPHENSTPLRLAELSRILWELSVGVYVFNSVPSIFLQGNHDRSSSAVIPAAYRDGLIGTALFEVDYFVKSLLHGTTILQSRQREEIAAKWRKMQPNSVRQGYKDLGMVYMIDDPQLGHDLYEPKKIPFIRHPPKFVDSNLAHSELIPRITTGEEFQQQSAHVSRDVFLRYLDNVGIGLVFAQESVQQDNAVFVLNPTVRVTSTVSSSMAEDVSSDLQRHLACYLQNQHDFVTENLQKKKEIAHYIDLLCFTSFVAQFLVTLKHHKKIVSFADFPEAKTGKVLNTSREVPPVLPSESSRWSPFTASDSFSSLHGGIVFHLPQLSPRTPDGDFMRTYKEMKLSGSLENHRDLATCEVGGKSYYVMEVSLEDYYLRSPKLPRWVHCMTAELRSQCARLPSLNPRVQELLRRSHGSREVAGMQTAPAQLLGAVRKGILPLVSLLLKRCTKTHLRKLDEAGLGLVHYAAAHCYCDVLSLLLVSGCPVDQAIEGTATQPIHLAAQSGGLDTICCLLRFGADVLVLDGGGWAPIHHSASRNFHIVVSHLCSIQDKCIDLKTEDRIAATPLLLAAKNGGFDTVQCLVGLGADVTARDGSGRGIVQLSALHHHIDILRYLVDLARPDTPVFQQLSEMLATGEAGFPEAAARSLDPLTQWRTEEHAAALLTHAAIPALVQLLGRKSDDKVQHLSVQVLANISSESAVKSALVGANAVPALVGLLASSSERVKACSCLVLSDLAMTPDNQASIVQAGALPHLVKLLNSDADNVQLFAAACLGILAYDSPSNQSSVASASGLEALKPLLSSDLSCIQSTTASTIRTVVEENRTCQLGALSVDVLPQLVHLLRSKEVSVHTEAALAIEAVAENCQEAQQELLGNSTCISLLKRLLRMRSFTVKVAGGRALWAIAGHLVSNQRVIATHMGLNLLVSMLTIHNEKLDFVCSEALGALATELGDNQKKIMEVGGVKPLIEVLTIPTSQRVYLSIISTISKLIVKPALRPNKQLQREVVKSRGLPVLATLACSQQSTEIVRVSAGWTLAILCLESPENVTFLRSNTEFSMDRIFEFLSSSDPTVQMRAGQSLATLAFNNPTQLAQLRQRSSIHVDFFLSFLHSQDESFRCCAGFQLAVLSKILTGIRDAEAVVKGIKVLISLLSSETESTQVLSASFIACLAHSSPGVPEALVMAGALDPLVSNLTSGSGPVIESCCVALGYFSFHVMAARLMKGMFRDQPEKFEVFHEYCSSIAVSKEFLTVWQYTERAGLPVLSLECRGGPPANEGWKTIHQHSSSRVRGTGERGKMKMVSLAQPSTLTQGTEFKSHSTLQKGSMAAESAAAALPRQVALLTSATEVSSHTPRGPLTARKAELERKKMGSKGRHHSVPKATNIQSIHIEGAHT